jgi:arginyl-tRNA synthetase
MLPEQQQTLIDCLARAVTRILPDAAPIILLERPKIASHGDLASNVAMQLAKPAKRNPRELAQQIVEALLTDAQANQLIASAELAGPGFINFRLTHAARAAVLPHQKAVVCETVSQSARTRRNGGTHWRSQKSGPDPQQSAAGSAISTQRNREVC